MTAGAVRRMGYSPRAMVGDYVRAGIGVALTAGPLVAVPSGSASVWVLGPLTVLFALFGLRTAWRHASRVELADDRISLFGPGRVSFPWHELAAVKLSYYATTADRQGGWMQLTLKGAGGGTIRLDSTLDGFVDVARRAARAAIDNGVRLSVASSSNFQALGISVELRAEAGTAAAHFNRTRR